MEKLNIYGIKKEVSKYLCHIHEKKADIIFFSNNEWAVTACCDKFKDEMTEKIRTNIIPKYTTQHNVYDEQGRVIL